MTALGRLIVAIVAMALLLAGCGAFSAPQKQLSPPVSQIASALATSHTAVEQSISKKTLGTVAQTSLSDMLTDVTDASSTISEIAVQTPKQSRLRHRALRAADEARSAILAAQEAQQKTGRSPTLKKALHRIDRVAAQVKKLIRQLPAPR